jgi:hypothetical protein
VKKILISASIVGAAGFAMGLFGAGVAAAATDVVGMTYQNAVSAIEGDGGTAKISVTVGDRQNAMGDCLVTGAEVSPFVRDTGGAFGHDSKVTLLALNCNRGVASANVPGASLGSPDGRAFEAKAEAAAAQQQSAGG